MLGLLYLNFIHSRKLMQESNEQEKQRTIDRDEIGEF